MSVLSAWLLAVAIYTRGRLIVCLVRLATLHIPVVETPVHKFCYIRKSSSIRYELYIGDLRDVLNCLGGMKSL